MQLFAFPHAGGGASVFKEWPGRLPPQIALRPVQYPGREARFGEPPYMSVSALVDDLEPVLRPELEQPFAFFGHSLGAFVAYELTRRLAQSGGARPLHLFVSAARAPHSALPSNPLYAMPEEELLEELKKMGGTPERVLGEAELMRLFLPMLRADFQMSDCYIRPESDPLIDSPVSAFMGGQDDQVNAAKLKLWSERAGAGYRLRTLPGDHFFIHSARELLLDSLMADLAPHCGAR